MFSEVKKINNFVCRDASVFERIFFNDGIFNSIEYRDGEGKRNSSYIQTFAEFPVIGTVAFVKKIIKTLSSILDREI